MFDYSPDFKKTRLSNGVTVVTEHHKYTRAASASIFVKKGTRDEPHGFAGVAHFIEHLVFKGTKNRSALDIARSLEAVGGDINAYTSREYTCFHTSSLREHLGLSLDVLCDIINNAAYDPVEFEKERDVVLQEIDMSADQLEEYIFDLCFEEAYQGHPLGRSILGTKESLKSFNPQKVKKFYNQQYRGDNLCVAVAGDVDHDEVVRICKEHLGRKKLAAADKKGSAHFSTKKLDKVKLNKFKTLHYRSSEQTHVLLNLPAASYRSDWRFQSYMVNAILGGGMTSRLYQKIREDKGWVYSVYSFLSSFVDTGMISLYAGTTEVYVEKIVKQFKTELDKLVRSGVTKKELEFFKKQVKGQILLGADDIDNRMNSIAVNEMVFGEYRPVEHVIEQIDSVTQQSVKEFCETFFDWKQAGLIILGNCSEEQASKAFKHI